MLWGAAHGALELRATGNGGVRVTGRFPYGAETELTPGRSEVVEARAFAGRIEAGADIHLLFGHDYDRPLASRAAGTLMVTDDDAGVSIDATVNGGTSWARDFLAAHGAGLVRGLSPGFRVPAGGERIERRGDGLLRRITAGEVFEFSAVTVPAYPQAQIEARNWAADRDANLHLYAGLHRTLGRWRA